LTTAFACMSTNSAIAQCGAVPVWVDVKPQSVEIDLDDFIEKISPKTKAVILYHVAGYPGPAKELAVLCQERGLALIEDCNNALYSSRDSVPVGSHGDFAVYSFYPTRQINTTEGGALICKSNEMATRARKLRRFGIDSVSFRNPNNEISPISNVPEIGWGFTMNNLCAALGCAQLATAYGRVLDTQSNAAKLMQLVGNIKGIQVMPVPLNSLPAYWVLLLLVDHRDTVMEYMKKQDVMASSLHHRNDVYSGFGSGVIHHLPNTSYLQEHILAIPCGWWLSDEDIQTISQNLSSAVCAALMP
ncbi:MAG: DegT/DnrJ/EryC1/StrS family aminotransferase, partial [Glaciimonas sp.]|nr:DegT/DnrJ/EryC1/StrS family aminotransferase [Glaciimonas sp.]